MFWWPLSNGNFGKIIKTWFFDKNYCILFEVQKLIKIQGLFLNVKIIGMCVRFIDLKKIKHSLSKRRERGKKHTQKTGWSVLKKKRLFLR